MATVTKCDRCGIVIDKLRDYQILRYESMESNTLLVSGTRDLCADCKRSFENWLCGEAIRGERWQKKNGLSSPI